MTTFWRPLAALAMLTFAAHPAFSAQGDKEKPKPKSRFEMFKQLAGDWEGTEAAPGAAGNKVHVRYKVTSAGSTVVETLSPDAPEEMVTTIHRDGDDIELTHYCALNNQPHMKAPDGGAGNSVAFKFTHATNMKSDKAMHMHNVTYTFVDKDTLKTVWTNFVNGKPNGTVAFTLKRKQ